MPDLRAVGERLDWVVLPTTPQTSLDSPLANSACLSLVRVRERSQRPLESCYRMGITLRSKFSSFHREAAV